jgi:hypothetical protein
VRTQARALAESGIRHINIPVGQLPEQDDLRRFIEVMTAELAAARRVLMHCKDGEGRAIAFAAIYRIEFEGCSPLQAYRAATRLPPGFKFVSILFPLAGLLSPRNIKTQFILDYRPTRARLEKSLASEITSSALLPALVGAAVVSLAIGSRGSAAVQAIAPDRTQALDREPAHAKATHPSRTQHYVKQDGVMVHLYD